MRFLTIFIRILVSPLSILVIPPPPFEIAAVFASIGAQSIGLVSE
jgi:uncharacterized membrane protein YgaE (UPF0421/DUF939 family)